MPTRSATTAWSGGLLDGTGRVELTNSKIGTYDVSWPRRSEDDAEGVTSPEELIAAAHSSCYCMAFSGMLGGAGGTDISLNVTADVTLGPDPAGGMRITGIVLHVSGGATGISPEQFAELAEDAKKGCPVSKALAATDIALDLVG